MLVVTELGQKLKEARGTKGLSIDQLHEITKIQKRHLVAIEEENTKKRRAEHNKNARKQREARKQKF